MINVYFPQGARVLAGGSNPQPHARQVYSKQTELPILFTHDWFDVLRVLSLLKMRAASFLEHPVHGHVGHNAVQTCSRNRLVRARNSITFKGTRRLSLLGHAQVVFSIILEACG